MYFDKSFLKFLRSLAKNNNREWFHENKKLYEKNVKDPFEHFVGDLIQKISKIEPSIDITPKEAIFRIHRDIRFSKDKTPYKTSVSAVVCKDGRKGMSNPGLYFQTGPEDMRIYGGMYMPDKDQLYNIRKTIASDPKAFSRLYTSKVFKEAYGEIHGEKNKKLPKEFQEAAEIEPMIYHKQFYFFKKFKPATIESPDLMKTIVSYYKAGSKIGKYLTEASK